MPQPRLRSGQAPRPVLAQMGESGLASAEPPVPILDPVEPPPSGLRIWGVRAATAVALLVGLGFFAAALMPERALALFEGRHAIKEIGVAQPAPVWEGKPLVLNKDRIPVATTAGTTSPAETPGKPESVASPPSQSLGPNDSDAVAANSSHNAPPPASTESGSHEPASPAEGPQSVWEKTGSRPLTERIVSRDAASSATAAPAEAHEEAGKSSGRDSESSESTASAPNSNNESFRSRRTTQNFDSDARPHPGSPNTNKRCC